MGCLEYPTLTRLDIALGVYHVTPWVGSPHTNLIFNVKHILWHLNVSLHIGIFFRPSTGTISLHDYLDVAWDGFLDTDRSMIGYYVFPTSSLILLRSNKQCCSLVQNLNRAPSEVYAKTVWFFDIRLLLHRLLFSIVTILALLI